MTSHVIIIYKVHVIVKSAFIDTRKLFPEPFLYSGTFDSINHTKKFIEWKVAKHYKPIILEINKACCGVFENEHNPENEKTYQLYKD